eukprot:6192414-Pleurochrysis_carterae.AAC.1
MRESRPVGVLLGKYLQGDVGNCPLYKSHHVCTSQFASSDGSEDSVTGRRNSTRGSKRSESKAVDRKGFHTFCLGDVVHCTVEGAESCEATVVGVMVITTGGQSTQMRRMLILRERAPAAGA